MKEHPILFTGAMVKAILDGTKTQTRRVLKPQPPDGMTAGFCPWVKTGWAFSELNPDGTLGGCKCSGGIVSQPYGHVGDLLWVRETTCQYGRDTYDMMSGYHWIAKKSKPILYVADNPDRKYADSIGDWYHRTFPCIHMKKKFARIWLEITKVRVERVQDISIKDIKAEGISEINIPYAKKKDLGWYYYKPMQELWDSLNAKRGYGWDVNPWVFVIEFKRNAGTR